MRDEVAWLALGVGIGSKQLLARLLAEVPPAAFTVGLQRQLLAALGRGRDSVRLLLESLGVHFDPDRTAADAVIDAAREHGERQAQRGLTRRLGAAAALMPPDEFRAYLAKQIEEYIGPGLATPEAAPGAEANGRQAGAGRGEAPTAPTVPRPGLLGEVSETRPSAR